ncbi:hypothetical protein [Aquimarina algiphila]|uniref:hypothetical protein n=1 Tax=Aquimarina algiphila TaxID=2047982 RepID=UPI00232DE425|nr:hypothetical protein [Aquimarina algiphila]
MATLILTAKASTNKVSNLEEVLNTADFPEDIPNKADKGYQLRKNRRLSKKRKLRNHILKKEIKINL